MFWHSFLSCSHPSLTSVSLAGLNGQAMESIPSTSVLKKPQEALSLSCRGTGFDFSQFGMHWIRQPAGKTLEWMGLIYYDASKTVYQSSVEGRIEITRDNSNKIVYLRLSNLKPEDSAVYYCARVTMIWVNWKALQKPQIYNLYNHLQGAAGDRKSSLRSEIWWQNCGTIPKHTEKTSIWKAQLRLWFVTSSFLWFLPTYAFVQQCTG